MFVKAKVLDYVLRENLLPIKDAESGTQQPEMSKASIYDEYVAIHSAEEYDIVNENDDTIQLKLYLHQRPAVTLHPIWFEGAKCCTFCLYDIIRVNNNLKHGNVFCVLLLE